MTEPAGATMLVPNAVTRTTPTISWASPRAASSLLVPIPRPPWCGVVTELPSYLWAPASRTERTRQVMPDSSVRVPISQGRERNPAVLVIS